MLQVLCEEKKKCAIPNRAGVYMRGKYANGVMQTVHESFFPVFLLKAIKIVAGVTVKFEVLQ